jgi:hypothetical protein
MPDIKDYWARKRHSARTDLWSGGGKAFRAWMRTGSGKKAQKGFPWGFAGIVSIGLVVSPLVVPLGWAATRDSCTAFETALLRRSFYDVFGAKHQPAWHMPTAASERKSASRGLIGRRIGKMEHPWLPHTISCTLLFWQVRISG